MKQTKKKLLSASQTFWLRMLGFVLFSFVLPVASIAWKFGLLTEREAGYKLTGWGILAVLFISLGVSTLVKRYTKDLPHSFLKQFLDTFLYVIIPLLYIIMPRCFRCWPAPSQARGAARPGGPASCRAPPARP